MNIHAENGDKIVFIGASDVQINFGHCDNPNGVLTVGDEYTVDHTEIHSWHTKVFIKEAVGAFPSSAFNDVKVWGCCDAL